MTVSKRTIFTSRMKMADMIASNYDLILMLPRFGITLGFGEKTVKDVCREANVDENLFLTVCNIYSFDDYRPDDEEVAAIDHRLVVEHLQASHRYYLEEEIAAVPERCAVGGCEIAVATGDVLAFPDDVHALESTVESFYMARLFES